MYARLAGLLGSQRASCERAPGSNGQSAAGVPALRSDGRLSVVLTPDRALTGFRAAMCAVGLLLAFKGGVAVEF